MSSLSRERSNHIKKVKDSKIINYIPSLTPLSTKDQECWEKLILNSTIENGWSSQMMIKFANPGLKLPSRKVLAGHILANNSNKIKNL